ncbi:MAG: hypothetical protein COW03_13335 [Cytophagales bacterium CG12_big_fil_rev_8_21_14_0_65_40_12]|nr:MAG: hypothetical protein COW03_13335 [Cytophagales bacterium CG12_big_fil_rev_8_21_14_0_65_40_12]PIW03119.1 MAG: hypothetical protein COW40_17410 [Cytophagales bacterium CG17_big_fil_post_rev_8_21_14_2_50_40_13]
MRFWTSLYFLVLAHLLVGQKNERLDFVDSIGKIYPDYKFVYMNDNYQINQFTIYDEHITLLLSSWNKGSEITDAHLLLLDPNSQITLDTLTFYKTMLRNHGRHFYYGIDKQNLIFRPLGGYFTETQRPFFNNLSIEIQIDKERFSHSKYIFDLEKSSLNLYFHFLNPINLNVEANRKDIALYINAQRQEVYEVKKIAPSLKLKEPVFYKNYFPQIITEKQVIVLDLLGNQLIFANKKDLKRQQIKNLDDLKNRAFRYDLLFDETYQNLYLKIENGTKAELYKLMGDEFKLLNIKLPKSWNYDGLGSNHSTPTFINNGKLYTVLSINQNGRQLDGIFMQVL